MFYGGGALVVRKQNQLIELFNKYGAINAENAISLDEVGVIKCFIFYRMVARNIFIQCENGKFYIDNQAAIKFKEQRRKKAFVALIVIVIICAIYYAVGVR